MRESRVRGRRAMRWNWTAFIWLAAFWAPVLGAFVHLLTQATDRLAVDAALVYVAALAVGLAAVTAVCVVAHALLIAGVRWLALQHDVWRRPAAAGLCVAIGWLLAYEWTYWATRVASAFAAPQPLPTALADAVGLGIALAYLLVGMGIVGVPLLPARATASVAPQVPEPARSAPRLIAPRPYPLAPTASVAAPTPAASAASTAPAAPTVRRPITRTMPPPALDTPLVLRYPSRPIVAPAAHPPTPPGAAEPSPAPRVVPVVVPPAATEPPQRATAPEPRTVPVLPPATEPTTDESVRISTEIYLEIVDDDHPPA